MPAAIPYVIVGAAFYGLDRLLRILRTRIVTATITTIPEMYSNQLVIPHINAGWRAGSSSVSVFYLEDRASEAGSSRTRSRSPAEAWVRAAHLMG